LFQKKRKFQRRKNKKSPEKRAVNQWGKGEKCNRVENKISVSGEKHR